MTDGTRQPGLPVGVILAGGQGRRLGGTDKVLCRVGGRPILTWIMARLAPQCHALVLNANGDPERFAGFGLPVVCDDPIDRDAGPLAGVLAAMTHVVRHWPDRDLLTVTGDVPFLPHDLVLRLTGARVALGNVAVARSGGRAHPLTALWSTGLRHQIRGNLREKGCRRVEAMLASFTVGHAAWPGGVDDPFLNINTPDDLAAAERRAAVLAQ